MSHLWHCLQHHVRALLEVQAPNPANQGLAGILVKAELLLKSRLALGLPCSRQLASLSSCSTVQAAAQLSTAHFMTMAAACFLQNLKIPNTASKVTMVGHPCS